MSSNKTVTIEEVDAILPQTQCGLCSYDGCRPYAEAIVNHHEALTLCPPGGTSGLKKLGTLLDQDITPFVDLMALKQKPTMLAFIREQDCIGCMKCIQACPVDAIIGSGKFMHTVIASECTGCELCVAPCPVDCIDMIEYEPFAKMNEGDAEAYKLARSNHYRQRYRNRNKRLAEQTKLQQEKYTQLKNKQEAIKAALLRAKS